MQKDYYQILQVAPNADLEVLNGAYRALVRQYHPDLGHSAQARRRMHERMLEINEAYQVLQDAKRRAEYDRVRRQCAGRGRAVETRRLLLLLVIILLLTRLLVSPMMGTLPSKALLLLGSLFLFFRFRRWLKSGN